MFETEEEYRSFAKQYISRRLKENKNDAIEELSAYVGNWMWMNRRARQFFQKIEAVAVGETAEKTAELKSKIEAKVKAL